MKTLTFPAFRNNGIAVPLTEVLAVITENDLVWSILEFNGIGEAPDNLSIDEFEKLVRSTPGGFLMSWSELKKLSERIDQIIDCLIVGAKNAKDIMNAKKNEDDFSSCVIVLSVFDSTEWSVWARDSELMKRFATVY